MGRVDRKAQLETDSTEASMIPPGSDAMMSSASRRSLDTFLDESYGSTSSVSVASLCVQWKFWVVMLSLGIANSSDASEILCLSYILSNQRFLDTILLNEPWRAELLASAVFFGMLIGGLVVGSCGDRLGRHPMLLLGLCCNFIAGLLSALAQNVWQLSALRCIAGLGIGATVPPLFTLVTELAPPRKRGLFITFCASFWMVGKHLRRTRGFASVGTLAALLESLCCRLCDSIGNWSLHGRNLGPRVTSISGHAPTAR
ncbi:sugar transporter [Fragilaria crotonensis]|nr:sugar transporter [Fragilaria crotonensis]